ncbi:MAG: hypothetical protein IPO08_22545 [Xanthomonadales bacterium]|nr:hypothetical protein [Xanthomonadales bacterium]
MVKFAITSEANMCQGLRQVIVMRQKQSVPGRFHAWGQYGEESGFAATPCAIVELLDGQIITPDPSDVQFVPGLNWAGAAQALSGLICSVRPQIDNRAVEVSVDGQNWQTLTYAFGLDFDWRSLLGLTPAAAQVYLDFVGRL